MRWNLDITSLGELLADVDLHLEQERQRGSEARNENPGERMMREARELHEGGQPVGEMSITAPADSPLGVELSKIRDRLNALEARIERLEANESGDHTSADWALMVVKRIEALEAGKRGEAAGYQEQNDRIGKLEARAKADTEEIAQAAIARYSNHARRIGALESTVECLKYDPQAFLRVGTGASGMAVQSTMVKPGDGLELLRPDLDSGPFVNLDDG